MSETTKSEQPQDANPEDAIRELEDRLGPKLEEAKARLMTIDDKVKGFIRSNPGASLLGAAAFGFLVGRLVSKK